MSCTCAVQISAAAQCDQSSRKLSTKTTGRKHFGMPQYSYADYVEIRANRVAARIVDNTAKSRSVVLLEMSCPWLANMEIKSCEKTEKYAPLLLEL